MSSSTMTNPRRSMLAPGSMPRASSPRCWPFLGATRSPGRNEPDVLTRKRADLLLVERGLFDSRARAQAAIAAGLVVADGKPVAKASEMLAPDAAIEAQAAHPFVSRGGLKLDHILTAFDIAVAGRVALDLGASTGG